MGSEGKPDTAAGFDFSVRAGRAQFFPQASNVRVDDVGTGIEVHIPDFVMQLAARDDLTAPHHQMLEQLELHRGQRHLVGVAGDPPRKAIEHEIADPDLFVDSGFHAMSGQRSYPRAQLLVRHRLHDVVVGTGIQSAHNRLSVRPS